MRRLTVVVFLGVAGTGVALFGVARGGEGRESARDAGKAQIETRSVDAKVPVPTVTEPIRLTTALRDDGHWDIAGVVGLTTDALGRTVIEVKKDANFETDRVLSLWMPLVELDTGQVVAGGIVSIRRNANTLTLTVRERSLEAGTIAGGSINGCEGADDHGHFFCIRYPQICGTHCDIKEILGVNICDCALAK